MIQMIQIFIWTAIIDIYLLLAINLMLSIYKRIKDIQKISEKKKDRILLEEYTQIYNLSDLSTSSLVKSVNTRSDELIKRIKERYND